MPSTLSAQLANLELGHLSVVTGAPDPTLSAPDPDAVTQTLAAVWSDLFRVALLRRREVIWVDMDAYCLAPYATSTGYLFGLNDGTGVLSGVVALPVGSAPLRWLEAFLFQAELVPPWREALVQLFEEGQRVRGEDLPGALDGMRVGDLDGHGMTAFLLSTTSV